MAGPWEKYKAPIAPVTEPVQADQAPSGNSLTSSSPPWEKYGQPVPETDIPKEDMPKEEFSPDYITKSDLEAIAKRNPGVRPEDLRQAVEYFSGQYDPLEPQSIKEMIGSAAKRTAGKAGKIFGLGVPQKVYRMSRDPQTERALDDLNELIEERKSGIESTVEILGSIGGAGTLSKAAGSIAPKFAKAYDIGSAVGGAATQQAAESRAGEELKGAARGAAFGAAGLAAVPVVKGLYKGGKALVNKATSESAPKIAEDIDIAATERLAERKPEIDAAKQVVKGSYTSDFKSYKLTTPEQTRANLLSPADRKKLSRDDSPFNKVILDELRANKIPETPENILDYASFQKAQNIASKLGDEKTLETLRREQGADYLERSLLRIFKRDAAVKEVSKLKLRERLPVWSATRRLASKFSDAKPLAKSFDNRLGLSGDLSVERTLDKLSENHNLYTIRLGNTLETIGKLRKEARDLKLNEQDIYKALDTGDIGNLPKEHVTKWKTLFSNLADSAEKAGLKIDKRVNYVPYRRLSPVKYMRALEDRITLLEGKVGKPLNKIDNKDLSKLRETDEFKDLENEINFLRGKVDDAEDFRFKLSSILEDGKANQAVLATDAFATKSRLGEIPEFVKEKELGNLASKWVQSTFRHAALRDGLDQLNKIADIANSAGDEFTTKYLRDLAADIVGSRSDTLAAQTKNLGNKFLIYAQRKAAKSTDPFVKRLWEGTGYLPEITNAMMRQVYPNYIGLNPKSVLQNLSSPILMHIPDVGYKAGSKAWLNSHLDMAKVLKEGIDIKLTPELAGQLGKQAGESIKTKDLNLVLRNAGLLPKQWTGEMVDALRESLKSNKSIDMTRGALDKYTNVMMAAFEKSEQYARAITYFIGRRLAKDLMADPRMASEFVKNLSSRAYQRELSEALQRGDLDTLERELTRYLNSTNMFNYDRINMSEYGRYLGPLFSIFSKWPTSISGRILQSYMDEGAGKATRRNVQVLLAPFLALGLVDYLTKPEDSDIYNRILGRGGLRSWTPANSIAPLLEGGILSSPAFQSGSALARAISSDKDQAVRKWANDFYDTFGFGSGLLRFFGEDVPVYRGEAKPTGPKIERRLIEIQNQLKDL